MLTAIETTATIGKNRQLTLDDDLPENTSAKVRVIVLIDETIANGNKRKHREAGSAEGLIKMSDDFDEPLIYKLEDGKPFEK